MAKLARSLVLALYVACVFGALAAGACGGFVCGYLDGYDAGVDYGWRTGKDNPASPPLPLAPWNQP